MNAIAANEVSSVHDGIEDTAHWSPTDDLLVWTVSRLEGGRRSGVESDCHVVYALTGNHFVEQTRRYRASAQQCIQMLLDNKKLGRMQRKIELNTIMALQSDARTGRLAIRTLNGTHYLEPVSNEEADVLREIAMEIEVRMPAGGAQFHRSPIDFDDENRVYSAEDDRRAAVAVDHARAEDEPDTVEPAHYVLSSPPPQMPAEVREYAAAEHVATEPNLATEQAQAPSGYSPPVEPAVEQSQQVPQNITVVGGVPITFAPSSESAQDPQVPDPHATTLSGYVPAAATIAGLQEAPNLVPAAAPEVEVERRVVDDPAFPAAFDRRQHRTFRSQLESATTQNPAPAEVSPYAAPGPVQESPFASPAPAEVSPYAAPGPVQESPFASPAPAEVSPFASPAPAEVSPYASPAPAEVSPYAAPGPVQESPFASPAPAEPSLYAPREPIEEPPYASPVPAPQSMQSAVHESPHAVPASAAMQPTAQQSPYADHQGVEATAHAEAAPLAAPATTHVDAPVTASEMYSAQPNVRPPGASPLMPSSDDRREKDDQPFPSIFDRRSLRAASEQTPGWLAPDDSAPDESGVEGEDADEPIEAALPDGPPTIGPPVISSSGPQTVSTGGAIGFNPDFDVNPFR